MTLGEFLKINLDKYENFVVLFVKIPSLAKTENPFDVFTSCQTQEERKLLLQAVKHILEDHKPN
jgi:hypothetical protein